MPTPMNRRKWLKATSLLTGGLAFLPSKWNELSANPMPFAPYKKPISDFDLIENTQPTLKARLFANENPFGPSPKAKQAIIDSLGTSYQYPMRSMGELVNKIAGFEDLDKKMVMMGAGSSPILAAVAMYFAKPGGNVVSAFPTYEDLPGHMEEMKATWKKVPLTADFKMDLDAMEKAVDANTTLVYLCNPNNPTGTHVEGDKLKAFCERVSKKVPVFVDEAYMDYLPNPQVVSVIDCVKKGQNVIVARTFSKLYGFAGLRMGYGIMQPEMIQKLEPYYYGTWAISHSTLQAALVSYNDREFLDEALKKTLASRDYLYKVLKEEGYTYIPSSANFVMFPIKMKGERFAEEMMKRGVGLRHWEFNNQQWCRISIGRMDEMEAFAAAFREIS